MGPDDVRPSFPATLTVDTTTAESILVMQMRGDLDLVTSSTLDGVVEEIDGVERTIVVDLSGVSFMDSTGLRALWGLRQHVVALGGRLWLRAPSEAVMRVLRTTKLDKVFDYAPPSDER